ncbi:hypothetical protein ACFX2J_030897 [Malus domestica]
MSSKGGKETLNQKACPRYLETMKLLRRWRIKRPIPRWMDVRPPQPCYKGSNVRIKGITMNLVPQITKKDLARLGQKWYVVRKNGKPVKEMRAYMMIRVRRQLKTRINSLKTTTTSEASENVKFEKVSQEGR